MGVTWGLNSGNGQDFWHLRLTTRMFASQSAVTRRCTPNGGWKTLVTLCCFEFNLWQMDIFPVWNHVSDHWSAAPFWSAGAREAHPGHLQSLQGPLRAYVSVPASLTLARLIKPNIPSWLGIRGTVKSGSTGDNQRLAGGETLACNRNTLLVYAANSWENRDHCQTWGARWAGASVSIHRFLQFKRWNLSL